VIVLGLDTSASGVACAVAAEDGVRAEWWMARPLGASEALLLALDHVLREARLTREAIEGIAVTHGPGSFTGVRVGLAAAQGLAWGLRAPLVTVSTIDALVAPLLTGFQTVAGVLDARRGEVYAGAAQEPAGANGDVSRLLDDCVGTPEAIAERIPSGALPVLVVGSGGEMLLAALRARGVRADAACAPNDGVRAGVVAWLGRRRLAAGRAVPPESAAATYLRGANARTRAEREAASL
jgi:tRNA threonylcarbamoyladenosine biosynthesis protein TsaB